MQRSSAQKQHNAKLRKCVNIAQPKPNFSIVYIHIVYIIIAFNKNKSCVYCKTPFFVWTITRAAVCHNTGGPSGSPPRTRLTSNPPARYFFILFHFIRPFPAPFSLFPHMRTRTVIVSAHAPALRQFPCYIRRNKRNGPLKGRNEAFSGKIREIEPCGGVSGL